MRIKPVDVTHDAMNVIRIPKMQVLLSARSSSHIWLISSKGLDEERCG